MVVFKKTTYKCFLLCILTAFCIIMISPISLFDKQAYAADIGADYWIKAVPNAYQETPSLGDKFIVQLGQHNAASDGVVRYRTIGYRMTTQTYNLDQYFKSGANEAIDFQYLDVDVSDVDVSSDGIKTTEYTILSKDFIKAAANLGITGEYIRDHNGAAVYLHNVFESFLNGSTRKSPIWGYQEFVDAESWSATTQNIVSYYYNYKFIITPKATYDIVVNYEDSEGNSLNGATGTTGSTVNNPMSSTPIIYGQRYDYSLAGNMQTLKKSGLTYNFTKCTFSYKLEGASSTTKSDKGKLTNISLSEVPNVEPNTDFVITMVFTKQPVQYTYKIVAVDSNGIYLRDIVTGPVATKAGDSVSNSTLSSFTLGTKKYNFQNKWYWSYQNQSGTWINSGNKTGNVSVLGMPSAKAESLATFYKVYDSASVTPIPPSPTPMVTLGAPTPTPYIEPEVVPLADSANLEFSTFTNTGVIRADVRGTERFTATAGVPTTESLFGEVTALEYLLGYRFEKKVGITYYTVTVSNDYILQWKTATPVSAGGPQAKTETVNIKQSFSVPRAYGFWEIENLECYKIANAVLNNYALPDGIITIYPNFTYYSPPTVVVNHSESMAYHVIAPDEVAQGIKLESEIISADEDTPSQKPSVPTEDFGYYALSRTGKNKVRSDYLSFNGNVVINNVIAQVDAPSINTAAIPQCWEYTDQNVLYKPNNIIEATKLNGNYASSGMITYAAIAKIGSNKPDSPQYAIEGINKVVIHTPVVCIPSITADNDKWVQLKKPTSGCVQLVLDPDDTLSDFIVKISNTGFHTGILGYFTRDFSKSMRDTTLSYITTDGGLLKNQVKFPFDVYIDKGTANKCSDDDFIEAGKWITVGRSTPRFYLPMTVAEGVYTVDFRTVAVNVNDNILSTQNYANTQRNKYVATETLKVEVSGRIYGLTVYDISDYPIWENVFRVPKSLDFKKDRTTYLSGTSSTSYNSSRFYKYTLGTSDQYGNDTGINAKYTFPLVNGSHPLYKNIGILKTGYMVRFSLQTTGSMYSDSCQVIITPKFYYVDANGKNRKEVDLYYSEEINGKSKTLVKVGSPLDKTNLKTYRTGDLYLGIPGSELKQTAALRGMTPTQFKEKTSPMYNFSNIRLNWAFRSYVNNTYADKVKAYTSYSDLLASGITRTSILQRMQNWYGQYYIPNDVLVVASGYDVMDYADKYGVDDNESFWLKEGYIIVNLTIETVGEDGTRRLSYINATNYTNNGNCSMWIKEAPVTSKKSYKGPTFNFFAGDFYVYYANKKISQDYSAGAIY